MRRARTRPTRYLGGLLALVLGAGSGACDDTFTPFQPGVQRLSVWGYLEVTRDTQWIRIGTLRSTIVTTSGDSLPIQATLEDVATGEISHMRQATVRFRADLTPVHNFWTTMPIRPAGSYHFRAQGKIANAVDAVVRVPADYRMEVLLGQGRNPTQMDSLVLIGLHYVAFVTASTVTVDSCGNAYQDVTFATVSDSLHDPHATPLIRPGAGSWRPGCGPRYVTGRTLSVVGSGSSWAQPPSEIGDVATGNITNGVGFLGGTLTRKIPYENCDYAFPSGDNLFCRLRYDSATVILTGRVWDPICAAPVPRARVTLQELDAPAPEVAKIRSIYTGVDGRYWMSALVPGMRYAMTVHRNEVPAMWSPDPPEFQDYTATVVFTAGQQATHDLDLLGHSFLRCPP